MLTWSRPDGPPLALAAPDAVIVGYAGRDAAAVEAHVRELAEHGVAPPVEVPALWEIPGSLVSQAPSLAARPGATSGEVEPVLVLTADGWFLTVGSDHTDREMEATSMVAAKRACPKMVGGACVALEPLARDWDAVELSSEIRVGGRWLAYQRGMLAQLRPLAWYRERFAGRENVVVFCGTVPTVDALRTDANAFRGRLWAPSGAELTVEYEVVGA
ncbi:MAG: hypothetical protein QOD92_2939 [Acidimicrobiaceae bacterium]|jgi:hypothetical protein